MPFKLNALLANNWCNHRQPKPTIERKLQSTIAQQNFRLPSPGETSDCQWPLKELHTLFQAEESGQLLMKIAPPSAIWKIVFILYIHLLKHLLSSSM